MLGLVTGESIISRLGGDVPVIDEVKPLADGTVSDKVLRKACLIAGLQCSNVIQGIIRGVVAYGPELAELEVSRLVFRPRITGPDVTIYGDVV